MGRAGADWRADHLRRKDKSLPTWIQRRTLLLPGHFQRGLFDLAAGFLDMPSEVLEQNFTVP